MVKTETRHAIRNSRGERIFDMVRTEKKIFLETSHKGKVTRIPLADEMSQIMEALSPKESCWLLDQMKR